MKAKKYWIWVIVSFSIIVVVWPTKQITGETDLSVKEKMAEINLTAREKSASSYKLVSIYEKELLQGLEGVHVVVEDIRPEVEKYGLRRQALQTDTELQLRQYGIKVLTRKEQLSTPGMPCLYINVGVFIDEEIPYAAMAVTVQLRESVLLVRDTKRICTDACTWYRDGVGGKGLLRIKNIRESVKDYVNEFINDYLAANPKETEEKSKNDK